MAFHMEPAALGRLLWGSLARDLGIEPAIRVRVYIADPDLGVVVCPYDDRGMDVIGPNTELLRRLYIRFHAYLLGYDMARMKQFFGAGHAAEPGAAPDPPP